MELGSIERELYVDAAPTTVFAVVSDPHHVAQWWPDRADYEPTPGASGDLTFGDPADGGVTVALTVVSSEPPHTFAFRWTHPAGETATAANSLLVTFHLMPSGAGTLLRMTETGFRERGWEAATLEQQYGEHVTGWDHYLPRLTAYAATLPAHP